jgi:hypothetical protein
MLDDAAPIATGNMLPAGRTVCVDINLAVVTKLADRGAGSRSGYVESFLRELALVVETAPWQRTRQAGREQKKKRSAAVPQNVQFGTTAW